MAIARTNLGAQNLKQVMVLLPILLLAVSLRLYNLDKYNLWYDEASSALVERGLDKLSSPAKLFDSAFLAKNLDYLRLYVHGPIYYWKQLSGSSEFTLRLSSVIFSLAAVYLLFLLGKASFTLNIASWAALLISISPFSIFYSQELKQYSALSFLTLLSAYAFLKIIKSGNKEHYYLFIASNVLNIYFHYMSLLVLFSFCVFLFFNIEELRRLLRPLTFAVALILFLTTPVLLSAYANLKFVLSNTFDPEFNDFPTWAGKVGIRNLVFTFKNFSIGYNTGYSSFSAKVAVLLYLSLFFLGIYRFRKKTEMRLFCFCLFVPILTLFTISQFKVCYVDRYFFSVFPFYLLIASCGMSWLSTRKYLTIAVSIIIASLSIFGLNNYYKFLLPEDHMQHIGVAGKQDTRKIAEIIINNYKEGDSIAHVCRNTVLPLKFYIRQFRPAPGLTARADKGTIIFFSRFFNNKLCVYDYNVFNSISIVPAEYTIVKNVDFGERLWLVFSDWYFADAKKDKYEVIDIIKGRYEEEKRDDVYGGSVYLLRRKK